MLLDYTLNQDRDITSENLYISALLVGVPLKNFSHHLNSSLGSGYTTP